jgi:hypothetical protein
VLVIDGAVTFAAVQAATKTIPIVAAIITDPERFGVACSTQSKPPLPFA